jgi:hypothetical protein
MWLGVRPREMCDQHLLGEHKELHQVVGLIEAGVNLGKTKQWVETGLINKRHEAIVAEMERRGMNHQSPLIYTGEVEVGDVDRQATRQELARRCEDCADRFLNTADAEHVEVDA